MSEEASQVKQDKPLRDDFGRWLKGSSGNPKGAPAGPRQNQSAKILQGLIGEDLLQFYHIARTMILSGEARDSVRANLILAMFDRIAGKVATQLNIVPYDQDAKQLTALELQQAIFNCEEIIKTEESKNE